MGAAAGPDDGGRRPLVAVSTNFADNGDYIGLGYSRPLLAAGALPVIMPFFETEDDRRTVLERIDGLVLGGGRDIEAWRYDRTEPHPAHGEASPRLDEIEISYARLAVSIGVPVVGICRGAQVLNVAFGGTLFGDLAEFPGGGIDHPGARWAEWRALVDATMADRPRPPHPVHPIEVKPGSLLAAHLGERAVVDSYHHQGIDRLGDGLEAVAWAPHGVIEAVEMPAARTLVLGVQWELHEEWQDDPNALALWRSFVDAARLRADERERAALVP